MSIHIFIEMSSTALRHLVNCRIIIIIIIIIQNWVQIISLCSPGLAKCHVTIQRCSVAPAPKLSETEKLLLCHRLTPRRSFFKDWQRVGKLMCSQGPRFRPRLAQSGTDYQCRHTFRLTVIITRQWCARTCCGRKFATAIRFHENRGSKQKCDSGHAASAT